MANYRKVARRQARRYGLAPDIFLRQIQQESGFNPHAVSPAGARGIAQFMPGTAAGLGINPDNPRQALRGAAKLMASYVKKYGNYRDALVAYNAGPGRVGHSLPAETQNYIKTILGGSNPGSGAVKTGGFGNVPGTRTVTETTSITPEAQQARRAALAQFVLSDRPDPLYLAQNYSALGDQTQTIRTVHHTPGSSSNGTATLHVTGVKGTANFEGTKVAGWIAPILRYARQHGWKGHVTSGFRSYADQQRIYNSGVRPAARPGTSNHEGTQYPRGAVDVSDAQRLSNILRNSPYRNRLIYAGAKDPVHFSHPHGGGY